MKIWNVKFEICIFFMLSLILFIYYSFEKQESNIKKVDNIVLKTNDVKKNNTLIKEENKSVVKGVSSNNLPIENKIISSTSISKEIKSYKSNTNLENTNLITNNSEKKHQKDIDIQKRLVTHYNGVKILMYHCVGEDIFGMKSLFVSTDEFDKQMKYLHDNGYTTITFDEIENAKKYKKPVIITFDDGYENNYKVAYPILKKYNLKASIFLVFNSLGKKKYLNIEQINEMKSSIEFLSHTLNHPNLSEISLEEAEYQISQSKYQLEKLLGSKVNSIAYPFGGYNYNIVNITKKYYKYGIATFYYYSDHLEDMPYQITRYGMYRESTMQDYINYLNSK